jgi:EpsI family protein
MFARHDAVSPAPAATSGTSRPDRPLPRRVATAFAVVALAVTAYGAHNVRGRLEGDGTDAAAVTRMSDAFATLPLEVGDFRGERRVWDERTVRAAGADAYCAVRYVGAGRRTYELFVGGALRNDDNFHSPNVCMPTAGWETLSAAESTVTAVPMQRLLLQRGDEQMLVYYWFQAGDRLASSEWAVRFYRLLDILRGRPLPPTLIISVYVPVEGDVAAADAAARRFLAALAPELRAATTSGVIHG